MKESTNKKIHNISVRFFGEDYNKEPEFQEFVTKIVDITVEGIEKRLDKLEKRVFKKAIHFSADGIEVSQNYKHMCNPKCN